MKIKLNSHKDYTSAAAAIEDAGYDYIGKGNVMTSGNQYSLFEKNGNIYQFISADCFNTTYYSAILHKIPQTIVPLFYLTDKGCHLSATD